METLDKLRSDILIIDSENVRIQKTNTRIRIDSQDKKLQIESNI
jgi:hypothetical protein